jgi:hypothetical protein
MMLELVFQRHEWDDRLPPLSHGDVVQLAVQVGIPRQLVQGALESLMRDGRVSEPRGPGQGYRATVELRRWGQ